MLLFTHVSLEPRLEFFCAFNGMSLDLQTEPAGITLQVFLFTVGNKFKNVRKITSIVAVKLHQVFLFSIAEAILHLVTVYVFFGHTTVYGASIEDQFKTKHKVAAT